MSASPMPVGATSAFVRRRSRTAFSSEWGLLFTTPMAGSRGCDGTDTGKDWDLNTIELEERTMPGARVAVTVTGNGLPATGRRWDAYRTVNRELHLGRTKAQRGEDRQALKAGETLRIKGYEIKRA